MLLNKIHTISPSKTTFLALSFLFHVSYGNKFQNLFIFVLSCSFLLGICFLEIANVSSKPSSHVRARTYNLSLSMQWEVFFQQVGVKLSVLCNTVGKIPLAQHLTDITN